MTPHHDILMLKIPDKISKHREHLFENVGHLILETLCFIFFKVLHSAQNTNYIFFVWKSFWLKCVHCPFQGVDLQQFFFTIGVKNHKDFFSTSKCHPYCFFTLTWKKMCVLWRFYVVSIAPWATLFYCCMRLH